MPNVTVNDVDLHHLEWGPADGPLAVLLHGFPDSAHTWRHLLPLLADAGFRAVAPFQRGYAPTSVPADGYYQTGALSLDAIELHSALGGDGDAVIVGHDWGASAAYSAAALAPDSVRLLVTIAIPHPAAVSPTPSTLWAVRHFFALNRRSALRWVPNDDFAYVDELMRRWSPNWNPGPEEAAEVKAVFRNPKNLEAALGYYRALRPWPPSSHKMKISVPTVSFAGDADILPPAAYEKARSRFTGPYEVVQMPGGHFMHREHPAVFNEKLLRVLERVKKLQA